jgi:hypothetical protein
VSQGRGALQLVFVVISRKKYKLACVLEALNLRLKAAHVVHLVHGRSIKTPAGEERRAAFALIQD